MGIGMIGESLSNSIEDVYVVNGLKHNLLSVSQLCDKDNLVVFTANRRLVVSMDTGDIVLRGKRYKNVYNCGPMRIMSRGGKRYVCVIVDDYSRFTLSLIHI